MEAGPSYLHFTEEKAEAQRGRMASPLQVDSDLVLLATVPPSCRLQQALPSPHPATGMPGRTHFSLLSRRLSTQLAITGDIYDTVHKAPFIFSRSLCLYIKWNSIRPLQREKERQRCGMNLSEVVFDSERRIYSNERM